MEVNDFEILLIDVTFYLERVQRLVFNVFIQIIKKELIVTADDLEILLIYVTFYLECVRKLVFNVLMKIEKIVTAVTYNLMFWS